MSGNKRDLEDAHESEDKRIAKHEVKRITNRERRQELNDKLRCLEDSHKLSRFHYELSGHSYLIKEETSNIIKHLDVLLELSETPENDEEYKEPPIELPFIIRGGGKITYYSNGSPEINEFEGMRMYRY